jgi:hypothetical protein
VRTRVAFLVILLVTLSGCGSDHVAPASLAIATEPPQTLAPRPVPSRTTSPRPSPSPSRKPSPSPKPSPAAKEIRCRGSDATPGKPDGRAIVETSSIWAGYVLYRPKTGVSCVEGSWVEPKVTCSSSGRQAISIWVGIDGVNSSGADVNASRTLVQIGTAADCRDGRLTHRAWHEVLPAQPSSVDIDALSIRPGDRIRAMVDYRSGVFTMRIEDRTTGRSFAMTQAVPDAPRQTAEWVVEAPSIECFSTCRALALARFSKVTFSAAYASVGSQRAGISDDKWFHSSIDMVRGGIIRSSVSALRSGGTSFSATWRHH